MDRITLYDKSFVPYIQYSELCTRIDAVAEKINNDFRDCKEPPVILCILNGSIMFTAELMQRIEFNCELVSLKLSSYQGTQSSGKIRKIMGMTGSIEGRDVIVVEDIVDTGGTIVALQDLLTEKGAKSIRICTMFLKPDVYDKDVRLDYVAMEIKNEFIVGFGLDYDELGRNYKDIYILEK